MLAWKVYRELICKTWHFGPLIALGNIVVTHGNKILPNRFVRWIARKRNVAIKRYLSPFVEDGCKNYKPCVTTAYDKDTAPVWMCWLQGEDNMPEITRLCVQSIRKYAGKHPVIILSLDNYTNYVEMAPHIVEKYQQGIIKHCHFADILRINILAKLGGVWMDATMLCTKPLVNRFFDSSFHSIKIHPFGSFVSQCRWAVYCLSAPAGSKLFGMLKQLFEEYLSVEDYFVDYFMFDQFIAMLYERDSAIRQMIDDVPFSNEDIMSLEGLLNEQFDEEEWKRLTHSTSLFKLSWKMKVEANSSLTYYNYLKSLFLTN
jgi:hypothetical protein